MQLLDLLEKDKRLKLEVISCTPNPQRAAYLAMHTCYAEGNPLDDLKYDTTESTYGERLVNKCLTFGHLGVLEHCHMSVLALGFPHEVMQQLRTHRILSFCVQSSRYTGKRFLSPGTDIEDLIYLRPVGTYYDRNGGSYEMTPEWRTERLAGIKRSADEYAYNIHKGMAEEDARGSNSFNIRQNFIVSGNLRAFLHLLMLRGKADAQLETQAFSFLLLKQLERWAPEVMYWWNTKGVKLKLAP
jgi:thymidylate synthase (FAD)